MHLTSQPVRPASIRMLRLLTILFFSYFTFAMAAEEPKRSFDVPASDAAVALKAFAEQSGQEIVYPADAVRGTRTNAVKGELTATEALNQMLAGTPLVASRSKKGVLSVNRTDDPNAQRAAQTSDRPIQSKKEDKTVELAVFEVVGSKILNMDIKRSPDDAQPYVVFDRTAIDNSGATNLEDFLKFRLSMNTVGLTNTEGGITAQFGAISQVNLRGLGTNQTLILIDGRRTATANVQNTLTQTDINGIPLGAIERIEVLPTTASGIYGGSATGGVINVILRRDYAGVETKLTYENTLHGDAATRRVDLSAGVTLEHGKTNLLLAGSYSDATMLVEQDRTFAQRGIARILSNNPGFYLNSTTPPLGATTNFRSANGSPLFGPGSPNYGSVPYGYAGGGGLAALAVNAGKYNFDLADTAQFTGKKLGLFNAPTLESLTATLRRQFSPRLQVFLEGSLSNNVGNFFLNSTTGTFTLAATAPNNPFGQAITVRVPVAASDVQITTFNYVRRLGGGLIVKLPADWTAEADYSWNYSSNNFTPFVRVATLATTPINSGAPDVLRDFTTRPTDFSPYLEPLIYTFGSFRSVLKDATARLSGPLLTLPAGKVTLSGLVEHREESIDEASQFQVGTVAVFPSRSQAVDSAYIEAKIPVVGEQTKLPLIQLLDFQLAGRVDDYVVKGVTGSFTAGTTTPIVRARNHSRSANPTLGVRYKPLQDIMVRASYGTGFLPPSVNDLAQSALPATATDSVDPRRGNTPAGTYQVLSGGNSSLKPEKSESWSGGIVLTPSFVPGLRLSVDYTRIKKTDNIVTLTRQQILDNESLFASRVVRGPNLPSDLPGWAGPITLINQTKANIARGEVEAYDLSLDYSTRDGAFGMLTVFASATWQTHYKTQIAPTVAIVENVGVSYNNPLKFKGNGGITWKKGAVTVGWASHYFDSYLVSSAAATIANQGNNGRVASQVYHDVFAGYKFARHRSERLLERTLSGVEIQVGVKNLFNREPPFDANNTSYGFYSPYGDPRLASYYLSIKRSF